MLHILKYINSLQSLAQNGINYTKDVYDAERYRNMINILAEMLANLSNINNEEDILKFFSSEIGYITPKIDVRGAVFKGNKLLLVKEKSDKLWSLPGGWADVNFSPAECVSKEILEEAGIKTKVIKLVAFLDKLKRGHPYQIPHTYKAFFLCERISGKCQPGLETEDVDFFELDKLPPLSLDRVIL